MVYATCLLQLVKLRETVQALNMKKAQYRTVIWFLAAFSIIMTSVAINRQLELDEAKQIYGRHGVEQLEKLTQSVGNNSVVMEKQDEMKELLKDQLSKESESHKDCKNTLKSVQSELRQIEKNHTDLQLEREKQSSKYQKCTEELTKCNGELTKCNDEHVKCNGEHTKCNEELAKCSQNLNQ